MSRLPIALAAAALALAPFAPADDKPAARPADPPKAPNVVGKYDCEGVDTNGTTYTAAVTIKKTGEAYAVEWDLGEGGKYVGAGVLTDRTLAVTWANRRIIGITLYTVEKDGTLAGKWTILGDPKGRVSKETLTKKVT